MVAMVSEFYFAGWGVRVCRRERGQGAMVRPRVRGGSLPAGISVCFLSLSGVLLVNYARAVILAVCSRRACTAGGVPEAETRQVDRYFLIKWILNRCVVWVLCSGACGWSGKLAKERMV